jgi:hypothetical protein
VIAVIKLGIPVSGEEIGLEPYPEPDIGRIGSSIGANLLRNIFVNARLRI